MRQRDPADARDEGGRLIILTSIAPPAPARTQSPRPRQMTTAINLDLAALAHRVKDWGRELGFNRVGIAGIDLSEDERLLNAWLAGGRHGEMHYMARHGTKRARPDELVPGTLRVIAARMDYFPSRAFNPNTVLADRALGYVSSYA